MWVRTEDNGSQVCLETPSKGEEGKPRGREVLVDGRCERVERCRSKRGVGWVESVSMAIVSFSVWEEECKGAADGQRCREAVH